MVISSIQRAVQCLTLAVAFCAAPAFAQKITVATDRPDGVYAVGSAVRWMVRTEGELTDVRYSVAPGQGVATASGPLAGETVEYTFETPGTVLLKVTGRRADGREVVGTGGAVAGVEKIGPSAPRPDDFDAFWAEKITELRAVPMDATLTPADAGRQNVEYHTLTLGNIRGTLVRGQIARPTQGEKFPAVLQVQYAGIYPLQKSAVTDRARDGWLALNISAHDLPIDQPEAFYKAQSAGPLKNYWAIGNDSRETSYYLRMYLSCVRAVDYLKSRPDWDGRTLVVYGGSQGGQQALVTAALADGVTAAIANVPAGCDMLGPTAGRRGGWPQWYEWTKGINWNAPADAAKVHEASRYFDVVNFASRVRCPALVGAGLVDDTCPVAGIIAAFNQMPSEKKKLVLMPGAPHQNVNNTHAPFENRQWRVWLPALLKGETPLLD
ncbi:MAG TPA: acetylxylan esterase [Tepidisphaeraceae bacterium]